MRTPPHDLGAESSVIGAMIMSEIVADEIPEILSERDFYSQTNAILFRTIQDLRSDGKPADSVTLRDRLKQDHEFERIGGAKYLFDLVESVPTTSNASKYAEIVKDKSTRRRLMDAASVAMQAALEEGDPLPDSIQKAESALFDVSGNAEKTDGLMTMGEVGADAMSYLQELIAQDGPVVGIPSGFKDVDNMTGGFHNGDLTILAARPAMGKTAWALDAALHAAEQGALGGFDVVFFSLEMSKRQLYFRLLSARSGVPLQVIRMGNPDPDQAQRIAQAHGELSTLPLHIDDSPASGVPSIRSRLRRLDARLRGRGRRVGLVVIDYLQLMSADTTRRDNRNEEVSKMSRGLKVLAREFDVPVLALSQLSRAVEQREDKRPMLSDLRDSGSIEQDADLVQFLYRDEYYNPDSDAKGLAEFIIGKQRQGPTGKVHLVFRPSMAKFGSLQRGGVAA